MIYSPATTMAAILALLTLIWCGILVVTVLRHSSWSFTQALRESLGVMIGSLTIMAVMFVAVLGSQWGWIGKSGARMLTMVVIIGGWLLWTSLRVHRRRKRMHQRRRTPHTYIPPCIEK